MPESYHLPTVCYDHCGQLRRAGFEFEVGNLSVVETAEALHGALGGDLEIASPFEATLRGSRVGKLKIERDAQLLKSMKYRSWLEKLGVDFSPGTVANDLETGLDTASRNLVPCEVVTSPLSLLELQHLDVLVATLSSLGAEGTQGSPLYAFGLHINPSIPEESADSLRRFIQAFLLLSDWITLTSEVDVTRRFLTKYIDPYPPAYEELVLDRDYRPDMAGLIGDYMRHNPTRNRALDMLPIFMVVDAELVLASLNEEERGLMSARPAFHFRLPDCKVSEPGWTPAHAWNQWVCIDNLAADPALLGELIDAWRANRERYTLATGARWALRLTHLLSKKFLAG